MRKKIIYGLSLVVCLALLAGPFTLGVGQEEPTLVGTGVLTAFKVTVTKVELWNGTAWAVIFSGSSELDLIPQVDGSPAKVQNGFTPIFPGIQDLVIPGGTYSQLRVTFLNSFYVEGNYTTQFNLEDNYTTQFGIYYETTTTTLYDDTAILAAQSEITYVTGNGASIRNPNWGALGAPVVQTFAIAQFTVDPATDYQPTIKFDASQSLKLYSVPSGQESYTYFFTLEQPTVTII